MATIGYGGMAPVTVAAHILVIVEAVFGLLFTALSTGLVFAKFTLAPSSVVFARRATISAMNGVPTLAFRVSNERGNLIVDATARVVLVRTETTAEGVRWYRMLDLKLQRDWMPAVSRGWSMLHTIDASSPLYGATLAILARDEVEFVVSLNGLDQTTLQPTHSIKRFGDDDVQFGYRHADMTSINAEGVFVMDVRQFDETVAASL
jgi:inward rectifier potassium channel